MTATDELRRMLDERGVEWETDRSGNRVMWGRPVDQFHDTMEFKAVDNAMPNGGLNVHICGFTPEQAIEATLGRGTCRIDVIDSGEIACYCCNERIMHCNGCGHEFGHVLYDEDGNVWMSEQPNFCPNCGRRIEQ